MKENNKGSSSVVEMETHTCVNASDRLSGAISDDPAPRHAPGCTRAAAHDTLRFARMPLLHPLPSRKASPLAPPHRESSSAWRCSSVHHPRNQNTAQRDYVFVLWVWYPQCRTHVLNLVRTKHCKIYSIRLRKFGTTTVNMILFHASLPPTRYTID
ncbi:hypothetical protein BC830DRAFT_528110 [Chytriomyces sp. MP71]|nr:hypothetical protein BC830DRAFT_528110 [Chytriomyces sp. MP71]